MNPDQLLYKNRRLNATGSISRHSEYPPATIARPDGNHSAWIVSLNDGIFFIIRVKNVLNKEKYYIICPVAWRLQIRIAF